MKDMDLNELEAVSGGIRLGGLAAANPAIATPATGGLDPFTQQFGAPFVGQPFDPFGGFIPFLQEGGGCHPCHPCGGGGGLGIGPGNGLGYLLNGGVPNGAVAAGAPPIVGGNVIGGTPFAPSPFGGFNVFGGVPAGTPVGSLTVGTAPAVGSPLGFRF